MDDYPLLQPVRYRKHHLKLSAAGRVSPEPALWPGTDVVSDETHISAICGCAACLSQQDFTHRHKTTHTTPVTSAPSRLHPTIYFSSRGEILPGGSIEVSAANLPVECWEFGGDAIWARHYADMMAQGRRTESGQSFEDWVLSFDHMAAHDW